MAEIWPAGLQQSMGTPNFKMTTGVTTIRSDVDAGFAKVRRRFTDGVDIYTTSIDMDIDDFNTLMAFYKTTLGGGVKTFNFYNPLEGEMDEFRFATEPSLDPLGGRMFRVSLVWERVP